MDCFFAGYKQTCRTLLAPLFIPVVVFSIIFQYLPQTVVSSVGDCHMFDIQKINNIIPSIIVSGTHYLLCLTLHNELYRIQPNWSFYNEFKNIILFASSLPTLDLNNGFDIFVDHNQQIFCSGNCQNIFPESNFFGLPLFLSSITDMFDKIILQQIVIGSENIFFLTDVGKIYSMGNNDHWQCGLGHASKISEPVMIPMSQSITQIAAGALHTLFLCLEQSIETGSVLVCGVNIFGILGIGRVSTIYQLKKPMSIPFFEYTIFPHEKIVIPPSKIISIHCRGYHSLIVNEFQSCYIFGLNNFGQCGRSISAGNLLIPQKIPNICVKNVSVSRHHSLIISSNNKLYSFGWNQNSQCSRWFRDQCVDWVYHLSGEELQIQSKYILIDVIAGLFEFSLIIFQDQGLFRTTKKTISIKFEKTKHE